VHVVEDSRDDLARRAGDVVRCNTLLHAHQFFTLKSTQALYYILLSNLYRHSNSVL